MAKLITEKKFSINVPEGKKKERLDTFLTGTLENATRSKIQKLIKNECVTLNGKRVKASSIIGPFDKVEVVIPISPRPEFHEPEDIPIEVVYEDEYLMVVNKPAGIVVHPAYGNFTGTLVNALLHYTKNLSKFNNDSVRPGIVHRIDRGTSGLLLVAKDEDTHAMLAKQFVDHSIEREYHAICWGLFNKSSGEIISNITRSKKDRKIFTVSESEGKHAHTFYEVIEEFEFASLVKLKLKTGRTHQIRVHMSSINHPIFGDTTYGGRTIVCGSSLPKIKSRVNNLLKIIDRQALHAKTLGFYHPQRKENVLFDSPIPRDIKEVLDKLKSTL